MYMHGNAEASICCEDQSYGCAGEDATADACGRAGAQ